MLSPATTPAALSAVLPHRTDHLLLLHAMRITVTDMLCDRPAVLAWQVRQQRQHEPASTPAGLDPREAARHPIEQSVRLGQPPDSLHARAVPRPGPPRRKITNHGWS